jgi:hypothetical protein
MAGLFDDLIPAGTPSGGGGLSFDDLIPQAPSKAYTSAVLPLSRDEKGSIHFDSNAGILGSIKRAISLPGDVYTGKVDPMSDEGIGRSMELAGIASPVNPAVRLGDFALGSVTRGMRKPPPPSAEALRSASGAGYDAARNMGVDYSSEAVGKLASGLRTGLEQDGILAELAPKTFSVLGKLESAPEGSVAPLSGIEAARRAFGNASKDFNNPTDQLAANRLVRGLDEFMSGSDPSAVVAGPAAAAGKAITDARGNYAAARRSETLMGRGEQDYSSVANRADLNAGTANSGQNLDNAIRQQAKSVLTNRTKSAGYSPEELSALEDVARGSPTRNAVRMIANLLGGGGGMGAAVTAGIGGGAGLATGSTALTAAGVASPVVGMLAKQLSNGLTSRALNKVDELVRMRSPLAESMPLVAAPADRRAALVRLLLSAHQKQN